MGRDQQALQGTGTSKNYEMGLQVAAIQHSCGGPQPDPASDRALQGRQQGTADKNTRGPPQVPGPPAMSKYCQKGGKPPTTGGGAIHLPHQHRATAQTIHREAPWAPGTQRQPVGPTGSTPRLSPQNTGARPIQPGGVAPRPRPWQLLTAKPSGAAELPTLLARQLGPGTRPAVDAPASVRRDEETPACSLPGTSDVVSGVGGRAGGSTKRRNVAFLVLRRQSLTVWRPSRRKAKPRSPALKGNKALVVPIKRHATASNIQPFLLTVPEKTGTL
ncbi:hypothetical protein NDU88_005121 [Pleurodeles waltl]|uniref:Uncharacterized protein n=1 Tax=Pleurodeles waltl TaxID=8319 RepID=A0AAV7M913_PLEWA|nr:hypothetical protein NDU88_005121 [Pleurodeles waltl]